jgi:hypothetical protein
VYNASFKGNGPKILAGRCLCQMLGYEQHSHAYCLFDVESRKVFTATHVVFDEYATSRPKQGLLQENLTGGDISRSIVGESIHIGFGNGNVNTHMDIRSDASDGSYTDAGEVGDSDGVGLAEAQFDEENAGDHVDNKEQEEGDSEQSHDEEEQGDNVEEQEVENEQYDDGEDQDGMEEQPVTLR